MIYICQLNQIQSVSVALFCAFLYGFGDACVNTQIYSIIGSLFPPESQMTSSAFALYKFTQSISAALSFFYSQSGLRLFVHLIILVSTATLSTLSFFLVENRFKVSQAWRWWLFRSLFCVVIIYSCATSYHQLCSPKTTNFILWMINTLW